MMIIYAFITPPNLNLTRPRVNKEFRIMYQASPRIDSHLTVLKAKDSQLDHKRDASSDYQVYLFSDRVQSIKIYRSLPSPTFHFSV